MWRPPIRLCHAVVAVALLGATACSQEPASAPPAAPAIAEEPAPAPAPATDPVPDLIATVRSGATPGTRLTAFDRLLRMDDERAVPLLLDVVATGWDQELIGLAIEILSQAQVPGAREVIAGRLTDADSRTRYQATVGLGRFSQRSVTPLLLDRLDDPSPRVAQAAAEALSSRTGISRPWPSGDDPQSQAQRQATAEAWRGWWREQGPGGLALAVTHADAPAATPRVPIERPLAPAFELQTLEGKTVRLEDLRGKPVLLNFWATWCTPCIAETADLVKTAGTFGDAATVVGIVSEFKNDSPARKLLQQMGVQPTPDTIRHVQERSVAAFLTRFGVSYPVVWGTPHVLDDYASYALPTTVIIRPDGTMHWRLISSRSTEDFVALLRGAAAAHD